MIDATVWLFVIDEKTNDEIDFKGSRRFSVLPREGESLWIGSPGGDPSLFKVVSVSHYFHEDGGTIVEVDALQERSGIDWQTVRTHLERYGFREV